MKKFFVLTLAAVAMLFASCGGGSNSGSSNNVEPLKEGVKFECDHYSVMLPTGMKESWKSGDLLNAQSEDGSVFFTANYYTGGPTKSQLKVTGEGLVGMVHGLNQEAKCEEPKVDGNMVTLKSIADGKVRLDYTYLKEDRIGVTGSLQFPEEDAAQWEEKFLPILKSIVFK